LEAMRTTVISNLLADVLIPILTGTFNSF